jgi:hypothetical protein
VGKINSLVLCGILLSLGSLAGYDFLLRQQGNFTQSKGHYTEAVGSSGVFLRAMLHELVEDPSLQENISSHLANSLQKNLLGKLRKGQLDHLEIADDNCQPLAHVGQKTSMPPLSCAQDGSAGTQIWAPPGESAPAVLALVRQETLKSGQKIWLRAQVLLNSSWLGLYPSLSEDFAHHSLTLLPESSGAFYPLQWREKSFQGEQLSTLWTSNRSLAFAVAHPEFPLLKTAVFWPLSVVTFLLLFVQWFFAARQSFKMRKIWQQFSGRVDSLFVSEGLVHHYLPENDPSLRVLPGALHAMQRIQQRIIEVHATLNRLKEENSSLEGKIASFHQLEERWKKDLAQMACYEGLAVQVRASALGIVKELEREADQQGDVVQAVKEAMFSTCNELQVITSSWQESLRVHGSRKFIRSLCEQKNLDSPFPNLLEEQLADILRHLHSLVDQGFYLCTKLGGQDEKIVDKKNILQRWYGLAQGSESSTSLSGTVFAQLIAQTLSLRGKNAELVQFSLEDASCSAALEEIPVPQATMAATLFHIFQSVAYALPATVKSGELSLRVKELKAETLILISCSEGDVYHDELRRQEMWNCVGRVNVLLAPYQVGFTLLPSSHDLTVFALKWQRGHSRVEREAVVMRPQELGV